MKKENRESVSKKEKEKYLSEAPLHIKNSSNPDVQNLWVEFKKIDDALETHPLRYYSFITKKGETDHIDCTWPNFKNIIKKKGGLETDIYEVHKRFKILGEIVRKKSAKKRQLDKLTGQIAKRVGILDIEETRLLEWFGKFYSVKEVQDKLKKELYYSPSLSQIEKWYKEHETEIDRLRANYTLKNKDFRVATDSGRLETLNDLLNYFDEKFKDSGKLEYSKEIRAILEQARKEVKGNELKLTVDGKIDVNATIQANVNITQTMQRIPVNALVIGLTAAKQGLNPERIMSQLASSYYKHLTGFNGEITGEEEVHLPSKLIKQYDWGELTRINQNKSTSNKKSSIQQIITINEPDKKENADMKKEELLRALAKYQRELNKL